MQTKRVVEQMTLLDLDTSYGKMFPAQQVPTAEKTSAASSKKSPKSSKPMFISLDMRANGLTEEASSWTTEALLGLSPMHSIGAFRSAENESVSWLTSTDLQRQGFCLTLNLSERPRVANPTLLSEVLEQEADPKYNLSSKACKGIINRANKRGKKLPEILEDALKAQIDDEEYS